MKLDDVDHKVQENLKERTNRKPYQAGGPQPLKADHSINLAGIAMDTGGIKGRAKTTSTPVDEDLSPRRPPSVGSIAGGTAEIDEKLHKLSKDYSELMDRYRRLKQMKRTPERDSEVNSLLGVSVMLICI